MSNHNPSSLTNSRSGDHLVQGLAADATVRVMAAVTTRLADEACQRHQTTRTASAALGRALTSALMLGRTFKDLERITVQIRGDGPLGSVIAEAGAQGTVRGYVRNPAADVPPNAFGKLDVAGLVGKGMLHVIREAAYEMGFTKEPYYGSVPLVSGEIGEDIAYYLATSEQINSAVSLGVFVGGDEMRDARVIASGGFLIQMMPGVTDETVAVLEHSLADTPHATEMIRQGADAEEILRIALGELSFEILHEMPLEFRCTCSYERAVNLITALGEEEVRDMLDKDQGATLTCEFCNESYWLDEAALEAILAPPAVM